MGPITPASMNMLLGMLARWSVPDAGPSEADSGPAEASSSSPSSASGPGGWAPASDGSGPAPRPTGPPAASPGNLGQVGDARAATDGGSVAPNPNLMGGDGLPPASSDDVATRFAPTVPVAQSLMGLRQPGTAPAGDPRGGGASAGSTAAGPAAPAVPAPATNDGDGSTTEPNRPAEVRGPGAPTPVRGTGGVDDGRGLDTPVRPEAPDQAVAPREATSGRQPDAAESATSPSDAVRGGTTTSAPDVDLVGGARDGGPGLAAGGAPTSHDAVPVGGASTSQAAASGRDDPASRDVVPEGGAPPAAGTAQADAVRPLPPSDVRPDAVDRPRADAEMVHRSRAEADGKALSSRKDDLVPWSSRQDAVVEHRPGPADAPVLRRDAVSDVDGWALPTLLTAAPADGQVERAGIIASFILNAAMIPGWPPPRPFDMPEVEVLFDHLLSGRAGSPTEEELAAFLAERGAEEGLLSRMKSRLAKSRRLRLLFAMTALWTTIEALIEAVEQELLRVSAQAQGQSDGDEDEDMRRALTA